VAAANPATDALASDDPRALDAAVEAIEHGPPDADALFAAGRACEDKLLDPARALALYERIAHELPQARVAAAAEHRAEQLRALVGAGREHAREAAELAKLIAEADAVPADAVIARASALAAASWPGAPDAALWLADWSRRTGRSTDARARYAEVVARWPDTPQALTARRGEAGAAIDGRDWSIAEALVEALPAATPADRILRDELAGQIEKGRRRDRVYLAAWLVAFGVLAALLASLVEACVRARSRPPLRPPVEVLFLAPVAAVIVGASFTANRAVAPAVTTISIGGLVFAWLSGAALDRLRMHGRPLRTRAVAHVVACLLGVAALGYIAMTRDGLVDLLIETVQFGPQD
jgi:hypothetical protein